MTSAAWMDRARAVTPGGVSSPVRDYRSFDVDREATAKLFAQERKAGRRKLVEVRALEVFGHYGFPLVPSTLGRIRFTRQSSREGRIATDAVVPETSWMFSGTSSRRIRTGTRCGKRTQSKVGST